MIEYKEHFLQEMNTLTSYQGADLSSEVNRSIKRTLVAYDLDRTSLYPLPKVNIKSNNLISAQRDAGGDSILEDFINSSFKDYISLINEGNKFHIFNQNEMKTSAINPLRLLEMEGVKWHVLIPIKIFGQLSAGLSVSRFENKEFDSELINCLELIGSIWFMILHNSRVNNSENMGSKPKIIDSEQLSFLTKRQLEILRMIGSGMSTKNISLVLNLSVRTIESHRYRISDKLNLDKEDTLSNFAIRNNILLQDTFEN